MNKPKTVYTPLHTVGKLEQVTGWRVMHLWGQNHYIIGKSDCQAKCRIVHWYGSDLSHPDPEMLIVATHHSIRYNAEHTTLATSHGFGTTTTVVVSGGGLKGVVIRNAFTEK